MPVSWPLADSFSLDPEEDPSSFITFFSKTKIKIEIKLKIKRKRLITEYALSTLQGQDFFLQHTYNNLFQYLTWMVSLALWYPKTNTQWKLQSSFETSATGFSFKQQKRNSEKFDFEKWNVGKEWTKTWKIGLQELDGADYVEKSFTPTLFF